LRLTRGVKDDDGAASEEARKWKEQAVHWQEMYLQLQIEQMGGDPAGDPLPNSGEEVLFLLVCFCCCG
jgi:hypothetical protein